MPLFTEEFESAAPDWPYLEVWPEGIKFTGKYRPPDYAQGWQWLLLGAGAACSIAMGVLIAAPRPDLGIAYFLAAASIIALPVAGLMPLVLAPWRPGLDIVFSNGSMNCGSGFGRKNYDVRHIRQFGVEAHEKDMKNRRKEQETGIMHSRTYLNALQVVMRYNTRRVVIASFRSKDEEKAFTLVQLLQDAHKIASGLGAKDTLPQAPAPAGAQEPAQREAVLR